MSTTALKPVFAEAWNKVRGSKQTFFVSFVILGFFQLVFLALHSIFHKPDAIHQAGIDFVMTIPFCFILNPLITGFYMLGVKRARDEEIQVKQVFNYYPKIIPLFLAQIVFILILWLAFMCISLPTTMLLLPLYLKFPHLTFIKFIIIALYALLAHTFMAILNFSWIQIADQNLPVWQAFKRSAKTVLVNFKLIFLAESTTLLLELASILTFGIAWLWILPFSYIVTGILYRNLFNL